MRASTSTRPSLAIDVVQPRGLNQSEATRPVFNEFERI